VLIQRPSRPERTIGAAGTPALPGYLAGEAMTGAQADQVRSENRGDGRGDAQPHRARVSVGDAHYSATPNSACASCLFFCGQTACHPRSTKSYRRNLTKGITMNVDSLESETDVVTKLSRRSVADTVAELTGMVSAKGMKVFGVIDQAAEARQVGLSLRETTLVLFGSPKAGTPVMAASPLAALDLPLKVLVWADGEQTKVSYYSPAAIAAHHHLSADLAGNLAGINALTDALVAP
jgi:uncharacterized protein (DUF302 family)